MPDSELNSFLKDLQPPQNVFDKPLNIEPIMDEEPEKETPMRKVELDEDGYPKNRQGRRKRAEDDRLRDEINQLNNRVKELSEVDKFRATTGEPEWIKKADVIFGNNEDQKVAFTNVLKDIFSGMKDEAKEEVLKEWDRRTNEELQEERKADDEVTNIFTILEDDYGINLNDESTLEGVKNLINRMSPKYDDGNIKEFPDPDAIGELYLELQKRTSSSRARDLADRSMTRSGESQPTRLKDNAVERFMEENGLGW